MSVTLLRQQALAIFKAALAAAAPAGAVTRHLKRRDVSRYRNIYVIGAGKAGASMAHAAERVLGRRITAGLINVKDGHVARLRPASLRTSRIELNQCGHPVPDARGVAGAGRIPQMAAGAQGDGLVGGPISGGAPGLTPPPAPGHPPQPEQ